MKRTLQKNVWISAGIKKQYENIELEQCMEEIKKDMSLCKTYYLEKGETDVKENWIYWCWDHGEIHGAQSDEGWL